MPSAMTTRFDFSFGGTPQVKVILEHGLWVSVDFTDEDVLSRVSIQTSKDVNKINKLAELFEQAADRLRGIAEELEEPEADDADTMPATDPAAYPELSMEVDG